MHGHQNHQIMAQMNSTETRDQASKVTNKVPPIPPPKPKINNKIRVGADPMRDEQVKIDVRQDIIKGSKNPTGSSCGESYEDEIRNKERLSPFGSKPQVMEIPRIHINPLSSHSSVISNEERDANLDIIFSDWNSKYSPTGIAQRQISVEPMKTSNSRIKPPETSQRHSYHSSTNSGSVHEPKLHVRETSGNKLHSKLDASGFSLASGRENKLVNGGKGPGCLLPKLEKQSNQVLVLAENNPAKLKDDVVRNSDHLEERIPGSGHTGSLLEYWKNVETSPEKESRFVENANLSDSVSDASVEIRYKDKPDFHKSISDESNPGKDLNDILQEFENFNKDFLDSNIFLEPDAPEEKDDQQKKENSVEDGYLMSKYDALLTNTTKKKDKRDTKEPSSHNESHEESVYYELDAEPSREVVKKVPDSVQETNSAKVTLIGFRKLNSVDNDSDVSSSANHSPSASRAEGSSQNNEAAKAEDQASKENDKKKTSSKQKCLVM